MKETDHSNELDSLLSEEGISNKKENTTKEESTAFKSNDSFKNAISNEEFSSVITVLNDVVDRILHALRERSNAKKDAYDRAMELKEKGIEDEDFSLLVKMVKSELMKTDVKMYETFEKSFNSLPTIINFLNRFRLHDDMIEQPNLSWIEKAKKNLKK